MSITTAIHIEHERLALVPTLRSLSGITIRVITQGTTNPGETFFPFLIEHDHREELEQSLDSDPTVADYEIVDWTDDRGIYYIEHSSEAKLISTVVADVNGFLLDTKTKENGWLVRLLLPGKAALNTIWEYARDQDIKMEILEIYENKGTNGESSYGLTDEQIAALIAAYENGYFSEPRERSLEDLASEMNLSSTAMSGRLRRGIRNLIAATISETQSDK